MMIIDLEHLHKELKELSREPHYVHIKDDLVRVPNGAIFWEWHGDGSLVTRVGDIDEKIYFIKTFNGALLGLFEFESLRMPLILCRSSTLIQIANRGLI